MNFDVVSTILSQSSTAQTAQAPLTAERRPPARAYPRPAFVVGALIGWFVQFLLLAIDPGFHPVRPGFLAVSLVLAALWGLCFRRGALPLPGNRGSGGALIGAGAALVHIIGILGCGTGIAVESYSFALLSFLVAMGIGAALDWAAPLLLDPWGAAMGLLSLVAGSLLVHDLAVLGVLGAGSGFSDAMMMTTGLVAVAALALLLGTRLGDLSLVVSPRQMAQRERFRHLAEALPIPMILASADNKRIVFSNQRSRQQFFLTASSGGVASTDALYVDPKEQLRLTDLIRRDGSIENYEVEMRRADGSTFWALVAARSISFNGEPSILAGYYDISDRKAAEDALLASEVRYALISRAANDGIWDWDIATGTVYYSARWREIVGANSSKRLSTLDDWLSRIHPEDVTRVKREIDEHIAGQTPQLDTEYRLQHGPGNYYWMKCRRIALRRSNGEPLRMAGSQSDITLRKTYEKNLLNAAYEDRLTGINNRAFFTNLVDTRNDEASIAGTAMLLFNIDQFRRLNDSLGSVAGDTLLIAVATRLAQRLKPQDALSRLGGDEFAIWLNDVADHGEALEATELMMADLAQPYVLGDIEMPVGISIGLAAPTLGDAASGADLLRNARLALDRAKLLGGARAELFDDALLRETQLRRRLSKDLTNAEKLGQIYFEYQPVVSLTSPDGYVIAGFETLMRWRHPELGPIPPARFIPIAEEAGMIGPLGLFAIESAVGEVSRWLASDLVPPDFAVAVNLSTRQISDQAGVKRLHDLLDRLPLSPGRLKLEITESVLMSDPEAMAVILHQLRQRGVELSLDDFGTGYSSLNYLHRFPLDVLKIDRSFVSRMCRAPEAFRLVRSIIELAHDLGLKVVAEGVERPEEVEHLRQLGCDYAQGYLFSRPVSPEKAEALLIKRVLG